MLDRRRYRRSARAPSPRRQQISSLDMLIYVVSIACNKTCPWERNSLPLPLSPLVDISNPSPPTPTAHPVYEFRPHVVHNMFIRTTYDLRGHRRSTRRTSLRPKKFSADPRLSPETACW